MNYRRKPPLGAQLLAAVSMGRRPRTAPDPWIRTVSLGFEDDDFEGSRNWSVIVVFCAMLAIPLLGLIVLFSL